MDHEQSTKTLETSAGEALSGPPVLFETNRIGVSPKTLVAVASILLAAGGFYAAFKNHMDDKTVHLREGERVDNAIVKTEIRAVLQQLQVGQVRLDERMESHGRDLEQIKRDLAVEIERHKRSNK